MDAAEVNPQVLLLAFTARTELFTAFQVIAKAGDSPLRPAVWGEHVERFSHFWRVDVARLAFDCRGFKYLESFENAPVKNKR